MALFRFSQISRLVAATALVAMAAAVPAPLTAQEEGPDALDDSARPGYSSLDVIQPRGTRELQNALQRLALNPGDVDALIDGGNAALLLGDPQAAIGFFARADEIDPGNGRVKAGLGSGVLHNENPYEALRLFDEAKKLGVPESVFASDRGLAYDLVGNSNAAQADYELALRRGGDDETIRRYALSLAISGDRAAAEAQLDPLLRKRDAAAWRTRAFVLAVTGDAQGAIEIADATMPKRMAASIEPFFRFMARLTPAQQAAAAHFGQFPQSAAIGKDDPRNRQYASAGSPRVRSGRADAGLIPAGDPLGPAADNPGRKVAKVDKSTRRRPGKPSKKEREALALAQAQAAVRPAPAPARPPGPVPPPDLLIPGRGGTPATVQPLPGRGSALATVQPLPGRSSAPATVQPLPGRGSAPATVQPLPGRGGTPATVQPLPGPASASAAVQSPSEPLPSVRPSVQALPAQMLVAQSQADTAQPLAGVTAVTAPPRQSAPADRTPMPAPSPDRASAPVRLAATPSSQVTAATPNAPPVAVQTARSPGEKPVVLAGVTDLPRPGFSSLPPPLSSPPARSVASAASASPAQALPPPPSAGSAAATVPSGGTAGATAGFDLARIAGQSAAAPVAAAPGTVQPSAASSPPAGVPAAPAPERISLSAVIASISVPPDELAPDANAVDITKIKPAAPKPDPRLAEAKKLDDKKAEEKKAAAKKAAAKPAPPKHPKRYWVQVAGGANRADLAKEWKRLVAEAPAVFKGKQGWWTPLNATNRLLTGPFSGPNEAQGFVNVLARSKLSGFAFTSPEGQEVTKLGG